jgi:serine protease Do
MRGRAFRVFSCVPVSGILIIFILMSISLTGCAASCPQPSFSSVVDKVMPSVVYILVEIPAEPPDEFGLASGSGVILRPDGYILTNRHVVENARRAEVTLQDRQVFTVSDIWTDDILDLAVIKIDANGLPTAKFGDPDSVKVGDWLVALGHPLGLSADEGGATVTAGIVSNLGRSFTIGGIPYYDVIQTDTAINPGNSGGPLVNLNGEVVGINSAGLGEAQNINFAINVATARQVFEDIVQYGRVLRPYLGAVLDDITPAIACEYCLEKRVGAIILSVEPDSPAYNAGLEKNDVIVQFAGEEIITAAQLVKVLWRKNVGTSVDVIFWRGEEEYQTTIILAERPD